MVAPRQNIFSELGGEPPIAGRRNLISSFMRRWLSPLRPKKINVPGETSSYQREHLLSVERRLIFRFIP
jgi:hypothetical protein